MKKKGFVKIALAIVFLFSSCLSAREKIATVVVKSDLIDLQKAEMISEKIERGYENSGDYKTVTSAGFYKKAFNRQMTFSDGNIAKIGKMLKTDLITAVEFLQKDAEIVAMARTVEAASGKAVKIIISEPLTSVDEFTTSYLDVFVKKLANEDQKKMPKGAFSFSTNAPVKMYLNKKKINPDLYLNNKLTAGYHKLAILSKDGSILDKRTLFVDKDEAVTLTYKHTDPVNVMLKSMLLPGLGQFMDGRKVSGSVFSIASLGSVAYLAINVMDHNTNVDDFDAAKASFDAAVTSADREAYRIKANKLQSDCDDSNGLVVASAAIFGVVYLANVVDSYFFTEENKFVVSRESDKEKFSFQPLLNINQDRVKAGIAFRW